MLVRGFLLAAAYNIFGMLIFSQGFSNTLLAQQDPAVFSWLGPASIVLWGVAYGTVARNYLAVPCLCLLFFIEKMIYVFTWLSWLLRHGHTLADLMAQSPTTALFFAVYGAGDLLFGLMFLWAARAGWQAK
ncbi:MAG: hypothetical protein HYZ45_03165 [Burkholderiales bacterium]|nr:hypothetical protein [Burkholderiales bacterium]